MPTYVFTCCLAGSIVQGFLALRLWKLAPSIISLIAIGIIGLTALAGGLYTVAALSIYSHYDQRDNLVFPVTLWLAPSAATDVTIAVLLVWALATARNKVSRFESSSLKKPLERLIYNSIETGSITTVMAIGTLVTYLTSKVSAAGLPRAEFRS